MAKFGQNPRLRILLLATDNRLLCEASPTDRIWGIGYNARWAMQFRQDWGDNMLGKALMSVREKFQETELQESG